jgi:hypothetical protein
MKGAAMKKMGMFAGLMGVALASCTSMHAPHPTAAENAVMCDKCKTTWVVRNSPVGRGLVSYTREKVMVCPDCKSAVQNWLETGKLKHSCSHCKGRMTCEKPVENAK